MDESKEIVKVVEDMRVFGSISGFETAQRMAVVLAKSELVPKEYQGKIHNCIIALEYASRMGASPLAVMQNLYIVHGKPSWSAQFVISAVNSCGKFSPLRFRFNADKTSCTAYAIELATGEVLEGAEVSIAMAKAEGWYQKNGSKWQTMPVLMLMYRASTFFGRIYAPEILMGMKTREERYDIDEKEEPGGIASQDFDLEIVPESDHGNPNEPEEIQTVEPIKSHITKGPGF